MTRTRHLRVALTLLAAVVMTAIAAAPADIPPRPEEIEFGPLDFEPPRAADYRHELSGGVPVYMAPSREFPLVKLTLTFKGGAYLGDPAVGAATGAMMRRGGTTTVSAEDMDERFDFLAASASTSVGSTVSRASLNCLKSNFDESFALFLDMVRNPGFQADRFELFKEEVIEQLKQRNDDAGSILRREWNALLFGRDHYAGREPAAADIESMTADDLRDLHGRIFHPGNLIVSVAGDFEPAAMKAALEAAFGGWPTGPIASDPPAPTVTVAPGVYHVQKDIPQGKVYVGQRGITRDDPDAFSMQLMNEILGGGGFTSRITKRVRSDEGLAYSAGSANMPQVYFPGQIRASVQSKNRTVALATKIILEEVGRIRTEPVSGDELETAKASIIETFPRRFESKERTLGLFVIDEMTGRERDYWQSYRDRVRAVSTEDILDVAQRRLDPKQVAIFIVGNWEEIAPGDLDGRASMEDFFGGEVTHLPLRDPLTLEPIESGR
ncbi:MAG: M16 family metallopeptidase [Planctomycetota bacterium]|jgi:predicted Zn-dependent peptidase